MKAITPFEHDIFISYAHIDDIPLMDGEAGWVSEFHKSLDALIRQILGDDPVIWRDPKLQGNDYFSDTLVEALPKAAVLISILSPRYIKSDWCRKELENFSRGAESTGGVRISDKSRIFKVMKTLVPREEQPPPLDSLLGYEFFRLNPTTGRPAEFRSEFGPEAKRDYLARLYDLAYEITELLKQIQKPDRGKTALSAPSDKKPIFLAETTSDLSEERNRVKSELRQLGYPVLPDKALPIDANNLRKAVQADLERCELSIHLIGNNYGFIPEGDQRSVVRLQNDIAAQHSRNHGLTRLIWMSPRLAPTNERHQKFIHYLENDLDAQKGADILKTSLEELKTIIQDKLEGQQENPSNTVLEDDLSLIYLICDQSDFEATAPLSDYLYSEGFEVLFPVFEGDESEVREDHTDKLVSSDAIIIYYGAAKELWLSSKLRDLRKLPGFTGSKPKLATAIYVAQPASIQKERFRTREATVIKDFKEFSPQALQPFMATIEAKKKGSRR